MQIATGIITIILGCIISIQSFILYMGSAVFNDKPTGQSSAMGLFVALLLFVSGAFAFKLPKVALFFATIAGLFGIMTGTTSEFKDMTVWGVIALIIALMNFFTARKTKTRATKDL